jgi:hypothetical protein
VREAHAARAIRERLLHALDQRALLARRLFFLGLRRLAADLAQVEPGLGHRLQRLALELGER